MKTRDDKMQWKNGYLGCCIIVLGIIATIIGAYILSIEVTDEEVTKYSYVADLNGLFDSEQAPTYIEYNPSTNFTGYYTEDSIIDDKKYFAGVDYDKSGMPNAYRLNLMPSNYSDGTETTLPSQDAFTGTVMLWGTTQYQSGQYNFISKENTMTNVPLASFISGLSPTADQNLIQLSSIDGADAVTWPQSQGVLTVDWLIFSVQGDWVNSSAGSGKILRVYSNAYNQLYNVNNPLPKLSAIIDLTNDSVQLFYDKDYQQQAGIYTLSEVVVSYGGSEPSSNWGLMLGTTMNYIYQTKAEPTYMDIRSGVSVED